MLLNIYTERYVENVDGKEKGKQHSKHYWAESQINECSTESKEKKAVVTGQRGKNLFKLPNIMPVQRFSNCGLGSTRWAMIQFQMGCMAPSSHTTGNNRAKNTGSRAVGQAGLLVEEKQGSLP